MQFPELEESAGVFRIATEGRRAVEPQVRGDDAVPSFQVALLGRLRLTVGRRRRRFPACALAGFDVRRQILRGCRR